MAKKATNIFCGEKYEEQKRRVETESITSITPLRILKHSGLFKEDAYAKVDKVRVDTVKKLLPLVTKKEQIPELRIWNLFVNVLFACLLEDGRPMIRKGKVSGYEITEAEKDIIWLIAKDRTYSVRKSIATKIKTAIKEGKVDQGAKLKQGTFYTINEKKEATVTRFYARSDTFPKEVIEAGLKARATGLESSVVSLNNETCAVLHSKDAFRRIAKSEGLECMTLAANHLYNRKR